MVQEIMKNCPKCPLALKMEYNMPSIIQESWMWLIEKVINGPISDIICLIPKIRHFDLFGDLFEANCVKEFQQDYLSLLKMILKYDGDILDLPLFLVEAIRAENVELVKFMAQKIEKHEFTAKLFLKLAEQSGNAEILEYIKSLIRLRKVLLRLGKR